MSLIKFFEAQKISRDRIGYNEPDHFDKLILALLVEIGECANEWRGFKFWSKDQEPRMKKKRKQLRKGLELLVTYEGVFEWVPYNPLLEEYVDGEHFFIELALELGIEPDDFYSYDEPLEGSTENVFTEIFYLVSMVKGQPDLEKKKLYLRMAHMVFVNLGDQRLGFKPEQIEQAYFEKHAINLQRQENGY